MTPDDQTTRVATGVPQTGHRQWKHAEHENGRLIKDDCASLPRTWLRFASALDEMFDSRGYHTFGPGDARAALTARHDKLFDKKLLPAMPLVIPEGTEDIPRNRYGEYTHVGTDRYNARHGFNLIFENKERTAAIVLANQYSANDQYGKLRLNVAMTISCCPGHHGFTTCM